MFTNSVLAMTGALLSVVAAVPMAEQHHHHHKRDYVWVTRTEAAVVTVDVTKTVWIEPGETSPVNQPQGYSVPASSSPDVEPAATSAPAAPAYTPESSTSSPAESSPDTPSVYAPPSTSSTSVYVAPTPTTPTSTYVPPPTTYAAPTTSTAAAYSAPAASSAASYGSSSSEVAGVSYGMAKAGTSYTGDLTWYQVGLGACGITNTQDQSIVAIAEAIFDAYDNGNPNKNPLCGKWVSITGKDGEQHQAQIVDRCTGCAKADLDLSEDFFNTVTDYGDGRVHSMEWIFV